MRSRAAILTLVVAITGLILPAALFAAELSDDPAAIRARIEEINRELDAIEAQKAELDARLPEDGAEEPRAFDEGVELPPNEYLKARVLAVEDKGLQSDVIQTERVFEYRVRLLTGAEKGAEKILISGSLDLKNSKRRIEAGDTVVVVKVI